MVEAMQNIPTLNSAQCEILNIMPCLQESDYAELKSLLVKFLNGRMQKEIARLYETGELSDQKMDDLSHTHLRTPYKHRI